jgi:DNA invertase Pin-like site-specific DNA recombinase
MESITKRGHDEFSSYPSRRPHVPKISQGNHCPRFVMGSHPGYRPEDAGGGRLVFGMMVQIAEFERELIRERVKAGMLDAKARGVHTGRRHTLRPHQRAEAARLHKDGQSLGKIAALFGCGRTVVYRAIHGDAA